MQRKLKSAILLAAALMPVMTSAQTDKAKASDDDQKNGTQQESAFTFTEAQLGDNDDMSQNVTIISSNNNLYASEVGYAFSPVRFRYRALGQKYNDVYINGMQMNDMETGQFRFSLVGGLNNQTRNQEAALPFEDNLFALSNIGGSNNYDFRAGDMATGNRASLLARNGNYTFRGMYTYNSGFNNKGWAWSASLTYRWADPTTSNVQGCFYNSLSYFFGVDKLLGDHRLSFSTWGNPTERASQGGATDEMYWIANNNFYNPYWGYQNGKVRNSRVVNDFAPSAIFTWDWKINDHAKLTTSLGGRYSMYKNTSLDYNNSDNPQPDYWKSLPSAYYDVWNQGNDRNNPYTIEEWQDLYNYLTASEANRQINWDRIYAANQGTNKYGSDAMYFLKAKHNDALNMQLNSVLNVGLGTKQHITAGFGLGANNGRHYMTVDDLLGAENFHNVNTFAMSTYGMNSDQVEYDLNNRGANLKEGDKYRYDYLINVRKANLWGAYTANVGIAHFLLGAKGSYTTMQRDGKMKNGLCPENSYGKSGTAKFGDGGAKASMTLNLGKGNTVSFGGGYELRAPQASMAFAAPEVNNDFCLDLKNEKALSTEFSYQLRSSWLFLNLNAYYNHFEDVTDWQNYYFDDNNSFTYVSMTGLKKDSYGVELGAKIKLASFLDIKLLGTMAEAKYTNDARARYLVSKRSEYIDSYVDASGQSQPLMVLSKNMRESGTPLTALSAGLSYHRDGWYIDLSANYYDRIYLSWSPSLRYSSVIAKRQAAGDVLYDNDGHLIRDAFAQEEGKGGLMVDGSIGRSIYLKRGSLSINLSVTNILNNIQICTGGYEQSRSSYTKNNNGGYDKRIYSFLYNPKKFYAYGTNGMLNITYKF